MPNEETEVKEIIGLMKARSLDVRTAAITYGIQCRRLGRIIRMVNAELGQETDESEMADICSIDDDLE
jgi:hypothetical protein